METLVLKIEMVEKILGEGLLFGKVAVALDIKPTTLPGLLYKNDPRLTQASVLRILREHLGVVQDSELLTELQPTI